MLWCTRSPPYFLRTVTAYSNCHANLQELSKGAFFNHQTSVDEYALISAHVSIRYHFTSVC